MRYLAIMVFLLNLGTVLSQADQASASDSQLLFYSDVMINASEASSRILAAKQFDAIIDEYLQEDSGNILDKEVLKYVSVNSNSDSTVHILTWPVKKDDGQYDFGGRIVNKGEVIKLNRVSELSDDSPYQAYSSKDWYGCIYYKMMEAGPDGYLIFGYDPSGLYENKKIVDIVTIKEDSITFGNSSFEDKEETGTYNERIILQYSSDANALLNYDSKLGIIIHDHLEPRMGLQQGQGVVNVPDGTYEGYELKEGKWLYKEKIFHHMYEEDEFPVPVPSKQMGLKKK